MLIRTALENGHSHVVELPDRPPSEPSVYWTDEGGENEHTHAVVYGGSSRGLIETEVSGHDTSVFSRDRTRLDKGNPDEGFVELPRGKTVLESEPADFAHRHVLEVLGF